MTRTSTALSLAFVSLLLTPVVVSATGTASDKTASLQVANAETAVVASAPARAEEPACARRVKVIYAGYGEAKAAPCTFAADAQR